MKYDFSTIMDRAGKDSIACDLIPIPGATVDESWTKIPMWVADMNFATVPTIQQAVIDPQREALVEGVRLQLVGALDLPQEGLPKGRFELIPLTLKTL